MINADYHAYYVHDLNDFPPPLLTGVAIPFAVLNSQRPRYGFSPNVYQLSSLSSYFGLEYKVLVPRSIVVLASGLLYSHFASHWELHDKKRVYVCSAANLSHNDASDTIFLPTGGTTSHRRKRFLLQHRELHRHMSQAPPPVSAVLKIEYAAAEECLREYSEAQER
ncbi:MAG: hypothetical protein V2B20_02995 [Pseudomonadota bacterium]